MGSQSSQLREGPVPKLIREVKAEVSYRHWQIQNHHQAPGTNYTLLPSLKDRSLRAASPGTLRRPVVVLFRFGELQSSTASVLNHAVSSQLICSCSTSQIPSFLG